MKRRTIFSALSLIVALVTIVACATPTPEIVEKEVIVTQVVKEVVKETVVVEGKEVEVTKIVEREVTKVVKE